MLIVSRRKYVTPESQATAIHNWHILTFDPKTKSLPDFLAELNKRAERAFGDNARRMIDSLLYAKLPPHLKRSLKLAYLENGTYDQNVAHLERELELSGLENDGESTMPTMTDIPPNDNQENTEQTKIVCHYCKKPCHVIRDCRTRMKTKKSKEMILQSKTPNLRHLNPLHHVLFANGQTIRQKNVGVAPKQQIDPNGSSWSNQQTIELMGKIKET